MNDFYSSQSSVTDPGEMAGWIDGIAGELRVVREAAGGLVFHQWAYGDPVARGFGAERMAEVGLRYADVMLKRAHTLNSGPPWAPRATTERLIGNCRDFTVLFLAIARYRAIAARARHGFADYLVPGWWLDHVIAEVWDEPARRWRLIEPQFEEGYTPRGEATPLDLLDMPRDRFLTGPRAWQLCRAGRLDPARFVLAPGIGRPMLKGWPYLVHNVVFDLACVNKREMLGWDLWGMLDTTEPPDVAICDRVDRLAAPLADPNVTVGRLQAAYTEPDLRVPDVIASYPPPDHKRTMVTLR